MIIAEIGWNHMGDISLAKKMILEAKNADLMNMLNFKSGVLKI